MPKKEASEAGFTRRTTLIPEASKLLTECGKSFAEDR